MMQACCVQPAVEARHLGVKPMGKVPGFAVSREVLQFVYYVD